MKLVRRINEQGIWQGDVLIKDDEELPIDCVDVPIHPRENGLILPRFDGTEWVEGASQERLDEIEVKKMESLFMPTQSEIDKATREIETITLLTDLGVI